MIHPNLNLTATTTKLEALGFTAITKQLFPARLR